ncbi:MAG: hypothetical protein J0H71_05725 [Rhizobiales bacterium]|nr:hypothetical protein [Hyphomicrobiales bacterium]
MRELASLGRANVGPAMPDRLNMVSIESALGGNTYYKLSPDECVLIKSTAHGQAYLGALPVNALNVSRSFESIATGGAASRGAGVAADQDRASNVRLFHRGGQLLSGVDARLFSCCCVGS